MALLLETGTEGDVTVLNVRGDLDADAARHLLALAAAAAQTCPAVHIDLDGVESMSEEAATVLLFHPAGGQQLPGRVILRTRRHPGRQAVLEAYARRRAGNTAGA